jgi:Zn-dependent protease
MSWGTRLRPGGWEFRLAASGCSFFGGVAELAGEPKKPGHEVVIALAGPAVTLALIVLYFAGEIVLATVAGARSELKGGLIELSGGGQALDGAGAVLFYLGVVNTVVLVFNMIPAFPLDGGRVFRGIVWSLTGDYLKSTRLAATLGIGFAWLLFLGGFLMAFGGNLIGGVWFFFLGMFLQNAAQSSVGYAQLQQLLRGVRVADMMRREPMTVTAGQTIREVVDEYFLRYPYKAYPVVEDGKFLGLLTLRAVQQSDRDRWDVTRASDLAVLPDQLPLVQANEPILQALQKLAASGASRLPVVENGSLVGLLCGRDVMDFMEVRGGLSHYRDEMFARDEAA